LSGGLQATDTRPIGVFDSGTGGLSVLRALREALPQQDFVYFDDSGFGPYGERDEAFVAERTLAIAALLRGHGIRALVIACNTASAAAVDAARARHPDLPVVGVEPALKPAVARSRTGHIGVIATRGTLASARFSALQAAVGGSAQFVLQPCDGLAAAIDALAQQPADAAPARVEALCRSYLGDMGRFGTDSGAIDTLVLGCTHYVLVQPLLQAIVGSQVELIATGEAVARQTARVLGLALEAPAPGTLPSGHLELLTSGAQARLEQAARHWLGTSRPQPLHTRS
jgi:glutamate racemase